MGKGVRQHLLLVPNELEGRRINSIAISTSTVIIPGKVEKVGTNIRSFREPSKVENKLNLKRGQ